VISRRSQMMEAEGRDPFLGRLKAGPTREGGVKGHLLPLRMKRRMLKLLDLGKKRIDRNATPVTAAASAATSDNADRLAAVDRTDELRSAFREFLSQRKRSGVGQSDNNVEGLFRDFLQWQASSHASH
jgi:hypothetical protein